MIILSISEMLVHMELDAGAVEPGKVWQSKIL